MSTPHDTPEEIQAQALAADPALALRDLAERLHKQVQVLSAVLNGMHTDVEDPDILTPAFTAISTVQDLADQLYRQLFPSAQD